MVGWRPYWPHAPHTPFPSGHPPARTSWRSIPPPRRAGRPGRGRAAGAERASHWVIVSDRPLDPDHPAKRRHGCLRVDRCHHRVAYRSPHWAAGWASLRERTPHCTARSRRLLDDYQGFGKAEHLARKPTIALATGQVVAFDKTRIDGLTDRGSG